MKTVLVIDDQAEIVEAVEDILSIIDVRVLSARNGREGIRIYQEHVGDIDLVLLDLFMPDLSGEETLAALRGVNTAVKVVLSSGYGDTKHVRKQFDNNVVGFLKKPFGVAQLMEVVNQHLQS